MKNNMELYLKKYILIIIMGLQGTCFAESDLDELMKTLQTQPAKAPMENTTGKNDPVKNYKKDYVVDWAIKPSFDLTDVELRQYKRSVKIKMTVLAASGLIIKSDVIQGSGVKFIDAKIIQALASAKLQPIPYADQTVIYEVEHEFSLKKPL
ncbi:hypothetical protein [Acinetobacter stercoris]|uniref:TonB family protein n=1 Tax=Acinetobacter stercoris TaxID=2126983 RepID=A0A2U3MYA6_9GAMM|nr:hypothetical protein [Acinetobacter stercoris]SPL70354.1 hypothetical protein KPC_1532 [Acinetobacter stercoris]